MEVTENGLQRDLPLSHQQREARAEAIQQRLLKKRESLAREYNVLKDLSHPNIISLEKVICASHNIYIFQELITGGDLLSYIVAGSRADIAQLASKITPQGECFRYIWLQLFDRKLN